MVAEDRFAHVLENLYMAALGDVGWDTAAALINDMIRTRGHSLVYGDPSPGREPVVHMARFFVGAERRQDLEHRYLRDYCWQDEAIPRLYGLRDGELVRKSDLYTDDEKRTSAAYNEFRRVNKTENGLFMTLLGVDGCGMVWTFGNSTERGGWGHEQIRTIKRLSPHIRQFARVRHLMANADALGASLAQLCENGRAGIIQLDRRGRILEANDRARETLLKGDGLRDEKGVLVAGHQENAELQRLLARALPPYGVQGAGGSMKIARRFNRAPLALEIHPVRMMGTDHRGRQVAALALVVDPVARHGVEPDLAAEVLGLTPAEGRVAVALAAGQTVAGVAASLGCAESTAKTHLKSVYRKLGIRKQTELVRRVLSLEALRGFVR